jgi:hypothetical protein
MGGVGVAQRVGMNTGRVEACGEGEIIQHLPEAAAGEMALLAARGKQIRFGAATCEAAFGQAEIISGAEAV